MSDFLMDIGSELRHHSVLTHDPLHNLAASLALSALAFVLTVLVGRPYIRFLKKKKIGKQIRAEGPESHMVKTGTPTMGGIMFTSVAVLLTVIFDLAGRLSMLLPLAVLIGSAILGGIDDFWNIVGGARTGLAARFKMAWLL